MVISTAASGVAIGSGVLVYAIFDRTLSPTSPLGDSIDVFVRREDAERFVDEVCGDQPALAKYLRIEERELETGGPNEPVGGSGAITLTTNRKRRSACAPLSPAQCVESAPRLLCGASAEVASERTGKPTFSHVQFAGGN